MAELTTEQQNNIRNYIEKFKDFLKTEKAIEWDKDRKHKTELIQKLLSKEHILNLTEEEFGEIIKALWANEMWTNKDYLSNKILKDNSLQKIREELKELIHGTEPLETRFDNFRKSIKGLGPSSITEILLFASPENYCLWNDKPKNVLPFLKIGLLPERVYKYQINGRDYAKCNDVLNLIRNELRKFGFEKSDFVDTDFFLAFIFYEILETQVQPQYGKETREEGLKAYIPKVEEMEIEAAKLSHTDIQGVLLELGNMLGYDTYVADPKKHIKVKN